MGAKKKRRYYDWPATFSRQTGTQGEMCIVVGAKNIGKTFGLRVQCVKDFIKRGDRFCEICRTKEEAGVVQNGYFEKLQKEGFFKGYVFKTEAGIGYIAKEAEKPDWQVICYFVGLTAFQTVKRQTFTGIKRFIFDEAVIDRKDQYHRYLPNEYLILANMLDSMSRQQPGGEQYRVYLLGNACDLTCPYMRYLGINKPPEFGYSFWNDKHTLLHYVEPWDAEEMEQDTLVGRMLQGSKEARMMYRNEFDDTGSDEIAKKTPEAKFMVAMVYNKDTYAIWLDNKRGLTFISSKVPKKTKNVITLLKADSTIDYQAVEKANPYLQMLSKMFYIGTLRYESPAMRDMFFKILDFLGIR